jgi:ATPase subunit of ABC transporter with duplicated ATPase domains
MVSDVSFSYDSKPVFSRVSLSFGAGWTALVGANGSGKSTLIKLIAGVLKPDRGSVSAPDVAVCPQDLDRPPDCFTDADILNNPEFFALLARLNITADWLERWDTLSGGEKKRCVIADALIRKPDALILDEPANHIDGETTALLAGALSRFEGAGIIVSHNMGFLDSLCTNTVILDPWEEGSRAVSIAANPVAALAEWDRKQDFLRGRKAALAEQAQKLDRAQKDAVRAAEQDKKAKLSKSALDPHDSAGRAKINLAVLSGRDRTGGKKAAALETALNRTRSDLDAVSVKGLRKTGAGLRGERLERPVLLALPEGAAVVAEGAVRIVHPAIEIRNDSRIVLSGNNGSGKTSLVEYILSALRLPARAVWRLKQELSWEDRAAALERFRALNNADRGAALSVVYRLGSEPDALLSTRSLSPGEARKLLFAFAMLEGASLVILDEPTNHLDAIAAAALADALNEFEGAALIVTHDRFFAAKTGKTFWRLDRTADGAKLEIADQA